MISNEMNAIIENYGHRLDEIIADEEVKLKTALLAINERYYKRCEEINAEYTGETS